MWRSSMLGRPGTALTAIPGTVILPGFAMHPTTAPLDCSAYSRISVSRWPLRKHQRSATWYKEDIYTEKDLHAGNPAPLDHSQLAV